MTEQHYGAVVANPGGLRWLAPLATALERAGLLSLYCTPIANTVKTRRLVAKLPPALARSAARELRLRPVPVGVPDERVQQVATLAGLGMVALMRNVTAVAAVDRGIAVTNVLFDRGTARCLRRGQHAVVAHTGACTLTFDLAGRLSIPSVLDYPIAHHDFAERILQEEAQRHPEFAETLQFARMSPDMRRRREREISSADRILLLSGFSVQTFLEAGVDARKLVHAPLGIDLQAFTPATEEEREAWDQKRPFRVLFAGQITQRKGISYLLDAFARADITNAELVFLGRPVGPTRSWIDKPHVRHWRPVAINDLRRLYLECDVFVLPSLVEGFPQTAAIAMACGLPIIVSENAFGPGVVDDGDNGHVVPVRDSDAIAERLRALWLNPDERQRMGAAARKRAEAFTWDRYGAQIVAAVRDL